MLFRCCIVLFALSPRVSLAQTPVLAKSAGCIPANFIGELLGPFDLCEGDSSILQVEAEGTELHYQWSLNGSPIGTDNDTLMTGPLPASEMNYQCIVTGLCGADTTSVTLYAEDVLEPVIEDVGGVLHCNVEGIVSMCQWYLNGVMIPGTTFGYYTPTVSGSYMVCVRSWNCWGCSPPFDFIISGIGDPMISNATMDYMSGTAEVIVDGLMKGSDLQVFDVTGRSFLAMRLPPGRSIVPLGHLVSGIYVARLDSLTLEFAR